MRNAGHLYSGTDERRMELTVRTLNLVASRNLKSFWSTHRNAHGFIFSEDAITRVITIISKAPSSWTQFEPVISDNWFSSLLTSPESN